MNSTPHNPPRTVSRKTENLTFYPRHGYRETRRATEDGYRRVFYSKSVDRLT